MFMLVLWAVKLIQKKALFSYVVQQLIFVPLEKLLKNICPVLGWQKEKHIIVANETAGHKKVNNHNKKHYLDAHQQSVTFYAGN